MNKLLDEAIQELRETKYASAGVFKGVFARVAIVIAESFVRIASALESIAEHYNDVE
jgi:hypothetical protein